MRKRIDMRIGRWRGLAVAATATVLMLALASCYIPDRFRSELLLSRYGEYRMTFDGDLLFAPMLHDYAENKVKPEDEPERMAAVQRDLSRDPAIKSVTPHGKGRFVVHYQREGRIGPNQLIALLRRDAALIRMKSTEDGRILIAANSVKPADAEAMGKFGVGMSGEFRITTDATVLQHNAAEVRPFGAYQVYIWKIENPLSPMPRMAIAREPDPAAAATRPPQ